VLHHPDAIERHAHARHQRLVSEADDERLAQTAMRRPDGWSWSARFGLAAALRTLAAAFRAAADRLEGRSRSSPLPAPR
jgi:hypothetical protein